MPEDVIYIASSQYAADTATLLLRSAVAGTVIGIERLGERERKIMTAAASAAMMLERNGGPPSDLSLSEGTPEWGMMRRSIARRLEAMPQESARFGEGQGLVGQIIGDVSVQFQAKGILDALEDPVKAERLDLGAWNVLEALREGGDIEDLVRRRAAGTYHELTPDQQDDIAESIVRGHLIQPDLAPAIEKAEVMVERLYRRPYDGQERDLEIGPITPEHQERARHLEDGSVFPGDLCETALIAHKRAFPLAQDQAGRIARLTILTMNPRDFETSTDAAIAIEQMRRNLHEIQGRVARGQASEDDRLIITGQAHLASTEARLAFAARNRDTNELAVTTKVGLGHHVADIEQSTPRTIVRTSGINTERNSSGYER